MKPTVEVNGRKGITLSHFSSCIRSLRNSMIVKNLKIELVENITSECRFKENGP